jgi:hypothetical protein
MEGTSLQAKKLIDAGVVDFGKQSWYYAKCRSAIGSLNEKQIHTAVLEILITIYLINLHLLLIFKFFAIGICKMLGFDLIKQYYFADMPSSNGLTSNEV